MSGDLFPLAPLTDEGLAVEREAVWDDLAGWAKAVAWALRYGSEIGPYTRERIARAAARHDVVIDAYRVRT